MPEWQSLSFKAFTHCKNKAGWGTKTFLKAQHSEASSTGDGAAPQCFQRVLHCSAAHKIKRRNFFVLKKPIDSAITAPGMYIP